MAGKEYSPRRDSLAIGPERDQVKALAKANLGLYRPDDLEASLMGIAQTTRDSVWTNRLDQGRDIETVAYFLGEEIACNVWQRTPTRNPALPFLGIERLSMPDALKDASNPPQILLMGCAGIASLSLEQRTLKELEIPIQKHTILDFSTLPLKRIHAVSPEQHLIQADAAQMPLPDASVDLVLSDLMLGSIPPQTEKVILAETRRVLKDDGQLVMRSSLLSDEHVEALASVMPYIGTLWEMDSTNQYGQDLEGRDNLLGLTSEQWQTFGALYSTFVEKTYFGPNRFTTGEQLQERLHGNGFLIQEQYQETGDVGTSIPFSYTSLRAQKGAATLARRV